MVSSAVARPAYECNFQEYSVLLVEIAKNRNNLRYFLLVYREKYPLRLKVLSACFLQKSHQVSRRQAW